MTDQRKRSVIIDTPAKALESRLRAGSRHVQNEPYHGIDTTGGLIERGVDVARAELSAWRRLSPRHRRSERLAAFDERVDALDAALTETRERLHRLFDRQAGAADRDAEALSEWFLGGRQGPRPEPEAHSLPDEIRSVQDDVEALERARDAVLAEKAEWVERNRDKLAQDAATVTAEARAGYLAAIETLEQARAALVGARLDELWTLTYPSAVAGQQPHRMQSIARALTARLERAGVSVGFDVPQLGSLLREDVDALATAIDDPHRAVLEGRDPHAPVTDAEWAQAPDYAAATRQQSEAASREAQARYDRMLADMTKKGT